MHLMSPDFRDLIAWLEGGHAFEFSGSEDLPKA